MGVAIFFAHRWSYYLGPLTLNIVPPPMLKLVLVELIVGHSHLKIFSSKVLVQSQWTDQLITADFVEFSQASYVRASFWVARFLFLHNHLMKKHVLVAS